MDVIVSRQPWMRLAVWLTMTTFIIGTSSHRHAQCVRSQDHGRAAAHLSRRALPWLLMALSARAGVAWQVLHDKLQFLAMGIHSRAGEAALTRSEAALASGMRVCE